jgi:hypothetical protein
MDMSNISLETLKKEKDLLEKKLTLINMMVDAYTDGNDVILSDYTFESSLSKMKKVPIDDFPYNKKWIEKLLFLIEQKKRFLNNHELSESLTSYYPDHNIDKLKRKVSVTISAAYKNNSIGGLIKHRLDNTPKGNVWGFKKWLDDNGEIIKKYRPFTDSGQMSFI